LGHNLCPAPLCFSASNISIYVGQAPCSNIVILNASAASCQVPGLQVADASYPQYRVVIQNSAGSNSSDLTSIYTSTVVTSANTSVYTAKVQAVSFNNSCLWDPTNATSGAIQASGRGWTFGLRLRASDTTVL